MNFGVSEVATEDLTFLSLIQNNSTNILLQRHSLPSSLRGEVLLCN